MTQMLNDSTKYSEKQWQKEILQIVQILFPKYIRVFEEVHIRDVYSGSNKRLDYMLLDSNGNIDIIEIKKPFDNCLVSPTKYRNNYVPKKELSGTIMQIEKYIYFLNKWGIDGEDKLTTKYQSVLPQNLRVRIVNPLGIIIMGRENLLNKDQIDDLEIIKRKYRNIVDIISYDDLLNRLQLIIGKFS